MTLSPINSIVYKQHWCSGCLRVCHTVSEGIHKTPLKVTIIMHLLLKHYCIINKFLMLNYAPRFNRNSITEIIKKTVYLPSAWTIIWLLSYQQLAVLQFLVHRVFLLNKRQTFSYKFHEQVAKWNFELLNPIMKDITKSIIEKIFLKALLAVVQLCVVIEVSTGAVHYGPLCAIWILGTEEFKWFQLCLCE